MKKTSLLLLLPLVVSSCVTTDSGLQAWNQAKEKGMAGLVTVPAFSDLPIPILRAPSLAAAWGEPQREQSANGHYRLSYADPDRPFERLVIYGHPNPLPALTTPPDESVQTMVEGELGEIRKPQTFQTTTVLGQPVRWFRESSGSGADGSYFESEGFTATSPDGRIGHYRLVIESVTGAAPERFGRVGW